MENNDSSENIALMNGAGALKARTGRKGPCAASFFGALFRSHGKKMEAHTNHDIHALYHIGK